MCGRFTLTANPQVVRDVFDLNAIPDGIEPRYNVAPTQPVAVITNEDPKTLTYHRWGLIPSWSKDLSIGNKLINARSETAHEKPAFRTAFKRRRCLIPASGFFEWKQADGSKIPHFIHLKEDPLFAFAGLWEVWYSPEGDQLRTCTILTTEANEFMSSLHTRMPVILKREDWDEWLQPEEQLVEVLMPLMKPYDSAAMDAYEVSTMVNRPNNDVPEVIRPVA
jgi:putative SOS response-associated peptidase YedK